MGLSGTIVYATVGRTQYGFDVFAAVLGSKIVESRLTDGSSINFNGQFLAGKQDTIKQDSVVYVSERTGCARLYLSTLEQSKAVPLPWIPSSLFHDRPLVCADQVYFISAHDSPDSHLRNWSALYSISLKGTQSCTRLTPIGEVDYSPAISLSGKYLAVASYGSRPWGGEFHELKTDIVAFQVSNPEKRVFVSERGGWPTWSSDSTIFFHRLADDGWWSIFEVEINFPEASGIPRRVTPPGLHCFTPAAFPDGKRLAVATRRRGKKNRHIEIFDLKTATFHAVTETLNPSLHHYNPFVSPDSSSVGYHRFRGESDVEHNMVPHFQPISSPEKHLRLSRCNGTFPSFSPGGDLIVLTSELTSNGCLKIVRADGSRGWTLLRGHVAFGNCWSPKEPNAIYTSLGSIFETAETEVQIARITFDLANLTEDRDEVPCITKILTKEGTGNNAFPTCSPDGKSLVIRSGRNGHKNLYIVDAVDGEDGDISQLTDGPWIDTMPSWSPKGNLIAFSSNRHNPHDQRAYSIYMVKPDGSDLRRIHFSGVSEMDRDRERINHVSFSLDGEHLVFTANFGGVTAEPVSWPNQFQPYGDLYTAKTDGSELKRLTWDGYENGTSTWHPGICELAAQGDHVVGERLLGRFEEPTWIS